MGGVEVRGPVIAGVDVVLTPEALAFVAGLQRRFAARRTDLLAARMARQTRLDAGERMDFLRETAALREAAWRCARVPADLLDRRVEITGPVERKMIINALNCGARVFMADFEDSTTPTWANVIDGQVNLRDAVRRTITYADPVSGKHYRLNARTAVLFVRVRGWHLEERHLWVDGEPVSGAIFDFGMYLFHNATELLARGTGPYFYLPKLESHLEARLWNDIFVDAQAELGIPLGTIRATVLIETILAAFEMDEILYELRQHSAGLNCGRWDYIFSFIKKLAADRSVLLPDRAQVTMTAHFMRSYSKLAVQTCHRREIHAIGGMSAFIPIKGDPVANERALAQVRADKEREATDGHDGTWVTHPGLVPVAMEVFDRVMPEPNQIAKKLDGFSASAEDLLRVPTGEITEGGLRQNVAVGLGYVEAWLRGIGCVPLFNLMEDAATAEISRAQLWQWVHHGAVLADGRPVTAELVESAVAGELALAATRVDGERLRAYQRAAELMRRLVRSERFEDFLTLSAYDEVLRAERAPGA